MPVTHTTHSRLRRALESPNKRVTIMKHRGNLARLPNAPGTPAIGADRTAEPAGWSLAVPSAPAGACLSRQWALAGALDRPMAFAGVPFPPPAAVRAGGGAHQSAGHAPVTIAG